MTHAAATAAFRHWAGEIARWSARGGDPVQVSPELLQRSADTPPPHDPRRSANGQCRLLPTPAGWIAFNLPRDEDLALLPALLGRPLAGDPWTALAQEASACDPQDLLARAHLLGLAAVRVGEALGPAGGTARAPAASTPDEDAAAALDEDDVAALDAAGGRWTRPPRVLDLSALWAGPLATALLARAGCTVLRLDGRRPPDAFGQVERPGIGRLDAGKQILRFALEDASGRRRLQALLDDADVVVTGMRLRAVQALGIDRAAAARRGRPLLWLAITAHGIDGPGAQRVGFGDDCAAAGGLLQQAPDGGPAFVADAIADPLTGLRAAALTLRALVLRRSGRLDVALAATAADAVRRQQAVPC